MIVDVQHQEGISSVQCWSIKGKAHLRERDYVRDAWRDGRRENRVIVYTPRRATKM